LAIELSAVPSEPVSSTLAQPDHQFRLLKIDQVLPQHEADTFVIDQRLSESVAAAGIIGSDLVGTDRQAQPTHAV
jgi:hypothetical protein